MFRTTASFFLTQEISIFPKGTILKFQYHITQFALAFSSLFLSSCPRRHPFKANIPNGALETDTSVIWVDLLKARREIPTRTSYISNDYKLKTSRDLTWLLKHKMYLPFKSSPIFSKFTTVSRMSYVFKICGSFSFISDPFIFFLSLHISSLLTVSSFSCTPLLPRCVQYLCMWTPF